MMQRKPITFRGCITDRVEVIVQLSHGKALCQLLHRAVSLQHFTEQTPPSTYRGYTLTSSSL